MSENCDASFGRGVIEAHRLRQIVQVIRTFLLLLHWHQTNIRSACFDAIDKKNPESTVEINTDVTPDKEENNNKK